MRHVKLRARLPGGDPAEAFEKLIAFELYPDLVEPVRTLEVEHISPEEILTHWSVFFRKGILNWSERDFLDRETLTIRFVQDEGDFDVLEGSWQVIPTETGYDVAFESTFDFGVASIESIVEPIAARVLKENVEVILKGLLGDVTFPEDENQPEGPVKVRHAVLDYSDADREAGLVGQGTGR